MDTVTYPEEKVAEEINRNFVPLKISVLDRPGEAQSFRGTWTPTFVVMDADLTEHYRSVGYLPVEDFWAQLVLARGRVAFDLGQYEQAAALFSQVVSQFPSTEAAPEAQYFLGVAGYKGGSVDKLLAAWKLLMEKYPQSDWSKKASFASEKYGPHSGSYWRQP